MAIIGCSGKIGSGKDTVGKIIQYLYYLKSDIHKGEKLSYEIFDKTNRVNNILVKSVVPEIHKFADALKDIICILTGCTREQLEDNDFKDSKLPEEWIRYGYADGFIKKYIGNGEMSGAIMNNKQCSKEEYEEHFKTNWQTAYKAHLTYRELLQQLGTDLFRDKLHNDVWVNALFSRYKGIQQTTISKDCPRQGIYDVTEADELQYGNIETIYPNWIITDTRVPNEAKAIKDRYGIIIRVSRESEADRFAKQDDDKSKYYHSSETALDEYTFDEYIDNNGTIEELIIKVKEILIKHKIL